MFEIACLFMDVVILVFIKSSSLNTEVIKINTEKSLKCFDITHFLVVTLFFKSLKDKKFL